MWAVPAAHVGIPNQSFQTRNVDFSSIGQWQLPLCPGAGKPVTQIYMLRLQHLRIWYSVHKLVVPITKVPFYYRTLRYGEKGEVAKISKAAPFFSGSIHQKHNLPICPIFIHARMRCYNLVKTKRFANLDLQRPFFNLPNQLL